MSRVQLAINVADLEASIAFYSAMFATQPHKLRPGYANFAIENPPLKLVLIEIPEADRGNGAAGALNHLGIEVFSDEEVIAAAERFTTAGLATFDERDTTCCYALQDKVWVHDPAGTPWEVYVVKDDNPEAVTTTRLPLDLLVGSSDEPCCTPSTGIRRSDSSVKS